jgi:hypothetical protein
MVLIKMDLIVMSVFLKIVFIVVHLFSVNASYIEVICL